MPALAKKWWGKMMKKNNFVLFCTLALLFNLSACTSGSTGMARSENAAATPAGSSQFLGDFQAIPGTNYLYAQISQNPNRGPGLGNWISSIASREDYGNISNLVFLDNQTLSSHTLFTGNNQIILSVLLFPDPSNATGTAVSLQQAQPVQPSQPAPSRPGNAVQWLVYQVVQKGTAQTPAAAGSVSDLPFSIAVSDADGSGYQEVLSGLTKTYGINMINGQQLLVIYTKNNVKTASLLDLAKRSVTATNPIVDLGAGVQ
jgi:hypothetical protein